MPDRAAGTSPAKDTYANCDPRLTVRERNWLGEQGQAQIEAKFDRLADLLDAARKAGA